MKDKDTVRVVLGLTALVIGVLVYLLDRPAANVYFLPDENPLFIGSMSIFGSVGQHLPTFLHPLAFSLITTGVLACRTPLSAALVSVGWLAANLFFEIGQGGAAGASLAAYIPSWFDHVLVLENTGNYLRHGTFDPKDVVSIGAGALLAFFINNYLNGERGDHETITEY